MTNAEAIKTLKGYKEVEEGWQIEENKDLIEALEIAIITLEEKEQTK